MKRFIIILLLVVLAIIGLFVYASVSDVNVETSTVQRDISDIIQGQDDETALPQ